MSTTKGMKISENARNWLNAISASEGTTRNGQVHYNIMFGGGEFHDLSKHPDTVIDGGRYKSAAAGAYQFMPGTWGRVSSALKLQDFGPYSQDQAALQLMRWRGVDPDTAPMTPENVHKLAPEWASLPTLSGKSYYGQPVKSFQFVAQAFGNPSATPQEPAPSLPPEPPTEVSQSPVQKSQTIKGLSQEELALAKMSAKLIEKQNQFGSGFKGQIVSPDFEEPQPQQDGTLAQRIIDFIKSRSTQQKNPYEMFAQDPLSSLSALTAKSNKAGSSFKPGKSVI